VDLKAFFSYKGPFYSTDFALPVQANRLRENIADLEPVRESLATPDDQEARLVITASAGSGKSVFISSLVSSLVAHAQQRDLQHAGSTVTINTAAIAADPFPDEITSDADALATIDQAARRLLTAVLPPYRPVHQWLSLAKLDLSDFPVPPPRQPKPVIGAAFRRRSASPGLPTWRPRAGSFLDGTASFAWLAARLAEESTPVTLFVRLDRLRQLRDGLLQLVDGILTALRFALVLVLAAVARRPHVRNFVLILVATSRHYGHRSEPDDYILPAHRWLSVVGGESALSC
jgi:hypothetical protein